MREQERAFRLTSMSRQNEVLFTISTADKAATNGEIEKVTGAARRSPSHVLGPHVLIPRRTHLRILVVGEAMGELTVRRQFSSGGHGGWRHKLCEADPHAAQPLALCVLVG